MKPFQLIRRWIAGCTKALPACGLQADWDDMVLVHYAFEPAQLQPWVPFPLEVFEGKAYVSLVSFKLKRMRPNKTGPIGRLMFRAISDHLFLNVRTYVRGPAGPGIYFIREWIDNRLSQLLGPGTYGLPYCFAPMQRVNCPGGTKLIEVGRGAGERLEILVPTQENPTRLAGSGTRAEFLLERYLAYTAYRGLKRCFKVRHARWQAEDLDWVRLETGLLKKNFPWFAQGIFSGGHRTRGFKDVFMSRPFCCCRETAPKNARACASPLHA